jgi:hypothetical protein
MLLSDSEVLEFIKLHDASYNGLLSSQHGFSRVVSLAHFSRLVESIGLENQSSVSIISGSMHELELKFLNSPKVTLLNFEENPALDLDHDWKKLNISTDHSFTLCNQVLEHVFNPHNAFKNICHVTAPSGYIWISIPTINCIHGEPFFYSSGFHPRFLERLALENDLEIISIGHWGSSKYLLNAIEGKWLYSNLLRKGIHRKGDLKFPFQIFKDGRLRDKRRNQIITDCWGLFRKMPNH